MKSNEIWKDIPEYEGLYQASNLGRIKSLLYGKEKILKTRIHPLGYELINLKNKTYRVHYLVAQAFIPNPNNLPEINHKNEIKNDNRVENLEWCSREYNCNYGNLPSKVSKRFAKAVMLIDERSEFQPIMPFESAMMAERLMGIDHSSIIKCCKGKIKTAGGYVWRYVDEL